MLSRRGADHSIVIIKAKIITEAMQIFPFQSLFLFLNKIDHSQEVLFCQAKNAGHFD